MALSAFDDKSKQPQPDAVREMLGRSSTHWDTVQKHLDRQHEPLTKEWNFLGQKYGWSLRLKHQKRTIVYMIPGRKHFLAGIVL